MNRVFRVIYNRRRNLIQVVSEIARGHTRARAGEKHSRLTAAVVTLLMAVSLSMGGAAGVSAVTLEQQVAANTTNIASNTVSINTNKNAINTLQTRVQNQQTAMNSKASTADLAAEKSERQAADAEINAKVDANTAAIEQNSDKIQENKDAIDANKADIEQNKNDIQANKDAIEGNENAISQNAADIQQNASDIADNRNSINTNLDRINNLADTLGITMGSDGTVTGESGLTKYFKAKSEDADSSYTETITNSDGTTSTRTTTLSHAEANAEGANSVAIGPNADSIGNQSVALGDGAITKGTANRGIAIGQGAITGVTSDMGADLGSDTATSSGGVDSISIGTDANSRGNDAISIGHNAEVQNIPVDGSGTKTSSGSMAIGSNAKVYGSNNSLALGSGATIAADNLNGNTANEAIAIGYNAAVKENATRAIAIGSEAVADKANAIAIGYKAESEKNSLALGNEANASQKGIAIGNGAQSKSANAQAFGNGAVATSEGDISIGNEAGVGSDSKRANVDGSLIAIGVKAGQNVVGTANVAVGDNAGSNVHSNYNVAIGSEAGQGFQTEETTDNPQNGYNVSIGYKANDFSDETVESGIQYATAIGAEAKAYSNSTAIGRNALSNGNYAIAFGENSHAYDGSSMAFGYNSVARYGNIAVGSGSTATTEASTLGTGYLTDQTAPTSYISVGTSDNLRRISNVADGSADNDVVTVRQLRTAVTQLSSGSGDTGSSGVSQSYVDEKINNLKSDMEALSKKYFSVSSNENTSQENKDNTGTSADNKNAMAIGPGVSAEADDAVAVGNNTKAAGAGSIAIGSEGPVVSAEDSNHITEANGERSVSIGSGSVAQTDNSIAIGTRATNYNQVNQDGTGSTQGSKSIAIGYYAETAGDSAVAAGEQAVAAGNESIAIGQNSGTGADATDSIAVGTSTQVSGTASTVVGAYNKVEGDRNHAFGTTNTMENTGTGDVQPIYESGMIGNDNKIEAINNNQDDHVGSINDAHMVGNDNTVSQENEGFTIKNVQIGGSNNTVKGEASTAAEAGSLTGVTIDGFNNTVIGRNLDGSLNAVENINIVGNDNKVDASAADRKADMSNIQILGSDVTATVGNSAYIGSGSTATAAAGSTTAGVGAYDSTIKDANYTTRDGSTATFAGSTASGVVTVGTSGSERRIQNVAAGLIGKGSTDAVNGSQLYYATRDHHYLGDNSDLTHNRNVVDVGSDGHINVVGETTDINGNRITTTEGLRNQLTDGNIGVIADTSNQSMVVKLNKDVVLGSNTQDGSLTLKNNNGQQTAKLTATNASSSLDGSATINRAALSGTANTTSSLSVSTLAATESTYAVATMSDGLSFIGDDGTTVNRVLNTQLTLTGGAEGTLTDNNIGVRSFSTDSGTGFTFQLASDLTDLNSVTTNNLTINGGDFVVENGTNVDMGGNQIHNVAAGTEPTDAVNVSQLRGLTVDVQNEINRVDGRIDHLGNRVNYAGANAAALAALHPLDFDPDDKWDFSAGYGNYRGADAVAVGAHYRPNEDTMFSVGGSFGGGENMFNAGISFKLGQGNHVSTSRVAMAKEIRDLKKALSEQAAEIAQLKSMHGLAIDPEKSELFPDVSENHWAYEYVSRLAGNGILKGYPDGEFKGDRMMTRYEFAAIVYRIVEGGMASTDPELSRLVKEFSPELKYIRIDTISRDKEGNPVIERVRTVKQA
jgi:hypothetical protein